MRRRLFVALSAFLVAMSVQCTTYGELGGVTIETCETRVSHQIAYADGTFTADERADLLRAAADWSELSNDRIHFVIVFGEGGRNARRVRRATSTDPALVAAERQAGLDGKNGSFAAITDAEGIVFAMDRIVREQFAFVARHELGHLAGLGPIGCHEPTDCAHSDDPDATMCGWPRTDHCNGASSLTQGDLAFCRASCLCDSLFGRADAGPGSIAGNAQ